MYHPSGKDRIIFVTKEDHEAPSNAELIADDPNDPYEEQGTNTASLCSVSALQTFFWNHIALH